MFDKWKEKLANKREFKMHDRVCERHFDCGDIIEYWENNINGEIHRTKRDKPKLRENAVPTLHLPSWSEFSATAASAQKKKIEILSHKIISTKRKIPADDEKAGKMRKILVISPVKNSKNTSEVVEEISEIEDAQFSIIDEQNEERKEKEVESFENLFDEAFDVTLPSTLWGIHRDPERKFLIFSTFDEKLMKFHKFLHLDCELKSKIVNNDKVTEGKLEIEKCTTDYISEWLDKIDTNV